MDDVMVELHRWPALFPPVREEGKASRFGSPSFRLFCGHLKMVVTNIHTLIIIIIIIICVT
jgi:hypothetical protein